MWYPVWKKSCSNCWNSPILIRRVAAMRHEERKMTLLWQIIWLKYLFKINLLGKQSLQNTDFALTDDDHGDASSPESLRMTANSNSRGTTILEFPRMMNIINKVSWTEGLWVSPVSVSNPNTAGLPPPLWERGAAAVALSVWPSCQAVPGIGFYIKAQCQRDAHSVPLVLFTPY